MKRFKLVSVEINDQHTKFSLFDPAGANCGFITILSEDVPDFISQWNWNGTLEWKNGLAPNSILSPRTITQNTTT
jgi:hypothetical protein